MGAVCLRASDLAKSFFLEQAEGIKSINRMNLVILTSCVADEQVPFERIRNKTMCFTDCLAEAVERDQTRPLTVPQAFEYARCRMPLLQKERARPLARTAHDQYGLLADHPCALRGWSRNKMY